MFSTQITKYDPLVSDTACHTRAVYLAFLERKSKNAGLEPQEEDYLKACEILTATQYRKVDAFGAILVEETDNTKIPLPEYKNASNNKKNTFLAQTKSKVATTTLNFLREACQKMKFGIDLSEVTFHIPSYHNYIHVLPLYYSAKMMLYCAAQQNIPVVVNIKRLRLCDENFILDGAASLVYGYDATSGKFLMQKMEDKDEQTAISMDMVSCYVPQTENEVCGFLASPTFKTFMEAFEEQDLAALVMICAIGHDQFPNTAETRDKKKAPRDFFMLNPGTENEKPDEKEELKLCLDECSLAEAKQLAGLARRYGFFRPEARYLRYERETNKLYRTATCLPFFIDHVKAATIKNCQEATAALLAERDNLMEPREENGALERRRK